MFSLAALRQNAVFDVPGLVDASLQSPGHPPSVCCHAVFLPRLSHVQISPFHKATSHLDWVRANDPILI